MAQSETIDLLAKALLAAQAEFSAVPKGSDNPFFKSKYAALPDVVKHAGPVLSKHGLAVSQFVDNVNGEDALTTYLIHSSGQYISHSMLLHLVKDDPQAQGSAITYARRYSYMAALGLVADEDDDGNAASKPANVARPSKAPQASSAPVTNSDGIEVIIKASQLDPTNTFIRSLVDQYQERGSLSEKQVLAGLRQAGRILRENQEAKIMITEAFGDVSVEYSPGEEPF
jgi:hypothetical protein